MISLGICDISIELNMI